VEHGRDFLSSSNNKENISVKKKQPTAAVMAHAMDLNSNNVTPELTPPPAVVAALESRNAPSAIHVRNLCHNQPNANLQ
jgi:hypothetical protein